jgi:hypothetical protein
MEDRKPAKISHTIRVMTRQGGLLYVCMMRRTNLRSIVSIMKEHSSFQFAFMKAIVWLCLHLDCAWPFANHIYDRSAKFEWVLR